MRSNKLLIAGIVSVLLGLLCVCGALAQTASVTLEWDPPVTNTDGTTLTDLAGYGLASGDAPGVYKSTNAVGMVTNTTIQVPYRAAAFSGTTYTLLYTPGGWTLSWSPVTNGPATTTYYAAVASNVYGRVSDPSNEIGITNGINAVLNYVLMWGTSITTMTNVYGNTTGTSITGPVTAFPRTTIYIRARANMVSGYMDYGQFAALDNRKPQKPVLRLRP